MEHVELFFKAIFIDNMVFAVFLGMCSDQYLLQPGALSWVDGSSNGEGFSGMDLGFLSFIMFIATIATMVQLVEIVVEKFSPSLYNSLGIFLPLIAVNCAILGH